MPVKQIPNLEWEKEKKTPTKTDQNSKSTRKERTGSTLRSSKNKDDKDELNEVIEQGETTQTKDKEQICTDFFSVAGTVLAAGVYTVAIY